jgi:hypothetical protein
MRNRGAIFQVLDQYVATASCALTIATTGREDAVANAATAAEAADTLCMDSEGVITKRLDHTVTKDFDLTTVRTLTAGARSTT